MHFCDRQKRGHKFQPKYNFKPLTLKFYAQHDNTEIVGNIMERYEHFASEIEKRIKYYNRDHYYAPITENQTYGWLERYAEKYTDFDKEILMHKVPRDEMMHVLKEITFDIYRLRQ